MPQIIETTIPAIAPPLSVTELLPTSGLAETPAAIDTPGNCEIMAIGGSEPSGVGEGSVNLKAG